VRFHKVEEIRVQNRQRKKIEPGPLRELRDSIFVKGLLHAPVVWYDGEVPKLLVGERRLEAFKSYYKDSKSELWYNGALIPFGHIPTTTVAESLGPDSLFELELDENRFRVNLTWQEESEALAELHKMRLAINPRQTEVETARELLEKGPVFGATNERRVQQKIAEAILVQKNIENPAVAKARNASEAFSIAAKSMEEFARGRLIALGLKKPQAASAIDIRCADLATALPLLEEALFDLILADPPYGINVGSGGFRGRTVQHHNYKDDLATARSVGSTILTEGFRVAKPRANLFMFNSIDNWEWFKQVASNMGWDYFPRPVIWGKSDSEGLAPWGSGGFRITTEYIFYATKGQRRLVSSPIDYLRENRVARDERVYGAEKPTTLIRKLIECSTLPGDYVLDPCCGSGTTLVAARECNRRALGLEKDEDAYYTALAKLGRTEDKDANIT
jgi:DNA modification methylase